MSDKSNARLGTKAVVPLLRDNGYKLYVSKTEATARSDGGRPLGVYLRTAKSLIANGTVVFDHDANQSTKVYRLA